MGQEQIQFGAKALRLPAKAAPEAAIRVICRFTEEREAGEAFAAWLDRVGGADAVAADLADLGVFPGPSIAPDFYVDFDETSPYVKDVGVSECAT